MTFAEQVLVDARGHLLGRLASTVAKELLAGQHVVCVRCEQIEISGSFIRNKLKYAAFLRKRHYTNPKKGPIHYRAPSKILWRTIRGMLPHKTKKGQAALQRLQVFEGIPAPYDKMKRVIVTDALRVTKLRPGRKYCSLGRLSTEVGWNHIDLMKRLEEKRIVKCGEFYAKTKAKNQARGAADKEVPKSDLLTASGY